MRVKRGHWLKTVKTTTLAMQDNLKHKEQGFTADHLPPKYWPFIVEINIEVTTIIITAIGISWGNKNSPVAGNGASLTLKLYVGSKKASDQGIYCGPYRKSDIVVLPCFSKLPTNYLISGYIFQLFLSYLLCKCLS